MALAVVLTRPSGTTAGGEVFLQPAAASGPDPFTESTATKVATPPPESPQPEDRSPAPTAPTAATGTTGTGTATRSVSGSSPGVYGGTKDIASCDVEKQVTVLGAQPVKNSAFASALGIQPTAVPGYLRSLTPVQLRLDTRVTNHGFRDGRANSYQAVLQAGTAVLVDDRGVPRVRCACGNPLGPPVALKANPKRFGQVWNSYQPTKVVVIAPAVTIVNKFVIYDQQDRRWYERDRGDSKGKRDKQVPPPVIPTPPITPFTLTPTPTRTPTQTPTSTPTPTPTSAPARSPAESPSPTPSESPAESPTESPAESPSVSPLESPTGALILTESPSPTPSPSVRSVTPETSPEPRTPTPEPEPLVTTPRPQPPLLSVPPSPPLPTPTVPLPTPAPQLPSPTPEDGGPQ